MISILAAFQFLTLIPPIIRRPFTSQEMGNSVAFYPLVGLGIGAVIYGADWGLSQIFQTEIRSALLLLIWVLLTGGLHLDGLLDSLDGLFGGFTAETRLEIMRDERVGAFGVIGGILALIIKFTAISVIPATSLAWLAVPVFSRLGMSFALVVFPYVRQVGLGKQIKDNTNWRHLLLAFLISALIGWLTTGLTGLGIMSLSLALSWLTGRYILKRIPGLTGDNYGAINEILEIFSILLFVGFGL